jgi:UDP-N-acetylmuramate--alanine ligase
MNVFFSGIGGAGIGPLAIIAKEAGFNVFGSDKQDSQYIKYLKSKDIYTYVGQTKEAIEKINSEAPLDWYVYSSAVAMENSKFPELDFCKENGIKTSKRDDFINAFISEKNLNMIAVAGTHGKTTTTAIVVWLMQSLDIPVSYSLGAKTSFGSMGKYDPRSSYFIYEADEFDRNFLKFKPYMSIISGIDYDHPDIYPTRQDYYKAFNDFICQSQNVVAHPEDLERIGMIADTEAVDISKLKLVGEVNRKNAQLVVQAVNELTDKPLEQLIDIANDFPGVSRRFEKIAKNIYSDYAHTPEKIRGALQTAQEKAGKNVVVVYEGLHNTRQHFIREDLKHLFDNVKLELLTPEKLLELTSKPEKAAPMQIDQKLKNAIQDHANKGDLVVCLTAGGGNSLDEWLRKEFV